MITMRRILFMFAALGVLPGCTNEDITFDDYDYQSVYFPYQAPVRTLVLGDEALGDNTIDRERSFSIGVAMGGAYYNDKDRIVEIAHAPELAQNVTNGNGGPMTVLPASHYEATFGPITIPKGSFAGTMRVDLTDAFFADPLSATTHYVIPVRITAAQDSVLRGIPSSFVEDPDPRIGDNWEVSPKDYTLFAIKYINETHGMYLLRGTRTNTATEETTTYSARFVTDNNMTKLSTVSLTENVMDVVGGTNSGGPHRMLLTFDHENQEVSVSQLDGTTVVSSGEGVYFTKDDPEAESYNGNKHRTIYLDYTYEDGGVTYAVQDSLVFVDTDVVFEEFQINVN